MSMPLEPRQISADGIQLIKDFEGLRLQTYSDAAGIPTIGYGTTRMNGRPVRRGLTLTPAQAEERLQADVATIVRWFHTSVPVRLTQSMFDALVSFVYNVGPGAFAGSSLYACLRAGLYSAAADRFLLWDKATNPHTGKKEPLPGLTRRRQAERALFLKDGFPP